MTFRTLALVSGTTECHFLGLGIQKKEQIWDGKRKMISLVLTYRKRQAHIVFPFNCDGSCCQMH